MKKIIALIVFLAVLFCLCTALSSFAEDQSITQSSTSAADQPQSTNYSDDEIIPSENWTATVSSAKGSLNGSKAIDGDMSTLWHTDYTSEGSTITSQVKPPHELVIAFPEITTISGVRYYPRTTGSYAGVAKEIETYVSYDGITFGMTDKRTCYYGSTERKAPTESQRYPVTVQFLKNLKVKAVKLVITDSWLDFGTCAEFRMLKPVERLDTVSSEEVITNKGDWTLLSLDKKDMKVSASSEQVVKYNLSAQNLLDGNYYNTWHTKYMNDDGTTEGFNEKQMPAWATIDLAKVHTISSIRYTPRSNAKSGQWMEFTISTSMDGVNYSAAETQTVEKTTGGSFATIDFILKNKVTCRYIRFDITKSLNDSRAYQNLHATGTELDFMVTKNDFDAQNISKRQLFVLTVNKTDMLVEKGGEASFTKGMDSAPFIYGSTTLIPLRGLFEEMGAEVTWIPEKQKVVVKKDGQTITFQIENDQVMVDNYRYNVTVAPMIVNGRTFIPLRFVSEIMGYKVDWNSETKAITISLYAD
ncbi:MAG: discoidin domain-containing protein [Bacillota bacterium]|nr:discoidin domain-containing protein [Bacillota bacterium]